MRDRPSTLRIEHLWAALPFSFVLWAGFHAPIRLSDFWIYLRLGQITVDTSRIPRVDVFSYTAFGKEYVVQSWLAAVVYHLVHSAAGLEALVALNALLLCAALGFSFHSALEESAGRLRPAVAGVAFAAAGLIMLRNMRPQVFSFLFFAIFYWLVLRMRRGKRVRWWLAPCAMVLWVNLHGAFVLGLALLAIALAGELLARGKAARPMGMALLLCSAATLVNPEGARLYLAVAAVARDTPSQRYVMEWMPPRVTEPYSLLAFFVPLACVGIVLLISRRKVGWSDGLVLAAFALFGATANRNAIWFDLAAAPIMASHFAALNVRSPETPNRPAVNRAVAAMILGITILISPWVYPRLGVQRIGASLLERDTPVGAIDFIDRHDIRGRIFHPQEYGDYMIWRLWPRQRTFIDSRVHLFGEEVIDDYIRAGRDSTEWEAILQKYRIQWILISHHVPEHGSLLERVRSSPAWVPVHDDGQTILFQRRAPAG